MTTLDDRPNTALLVIDMQNGVMASAHERAAVEATVARLVEKARHTVVPVIWVQHGDDHVLKGSIEWQIVPALHPYESEPLIEKSHGDAFEATHLEKVLAAAKIGRVVVVGAQTDMCVRSTIHGAFARGYDVTLVGDAHTTEDLTAWGAPPPEKVIAHTNLYWNQQTAPGRKAETVDARDVDFRAPVLRDI